jgi:hypothetical protein
MLGARQRHPGRNDLSEAPPGSAVLENSRRRSWRRRVHRKGAVWWHSRRAATSAKLDLHIYNFQLRVTCLAVQGKRATVGGEVVSGFQTTRARTAHLIPRQRRRQHARSASELHLLGESTAFLPAVTSRLPGGFTVYGGDVDVHDVPASKEECKNGGWRNFGSMFKNQGQCAAFVEHGPKSPKP